jgi:D-alanyl-D-alanine carboxypeptidase
LIDHAPATNSQVERLEEVLRSVVSRRSIRHAIMAVESGDGSFRWHAAGGMTNGSPATPDQPLYIASIDKLYNATIALRLSEDGSLLLDEPITSFLPETITRGLHRIGGEDHTGRITVRHLLAHASGLGEWLEDAPKGEPSLLERIVEEGDREIAVEEIAAHVRDRLKPHFPPQDLSGPRPGVRYCDTNYILLARIIEVVAGKPLREVHEDILIEPLDLRHTFFLGRTEPRSPTPPPTPLRAGGASLNVPLILRSINSIYSTASDSIAFLRGLMQGRIFRNPETLQLMQANWNRFGFPGDRAALRAPNWPIEYGLGIKRFRLPRLLTPLRPVPAVVGHTGSTGCWLFYCPDLDLFLSGSVDEVTAGALPYRVVPRILRIMASGR